LKSSKGFLRAVLKEVAFIAGKSENQAAKKIYIRFSIDNSIANISFYALSCLKFNFGYYFTFEIVFLGFKTREFCLFDELQDLTDSANPFSGDFCYCFLLQI
jgi:hypothetical protein